MASEDLLHFILIPLMSQGHLIPMIDMARLIAERGVIVTIVTTPLNTLRFKSVIDRSIDSGLPIRLLQLRFPSVEAGLPEGCESSDTLPSWNSRINFYRALAMLQQPFEESFADLQPVPSCIISDMCFPWTSETARKFNIPRIVFNGMCCFYLSSWHNMLHNKVHESITSDSELFVVPGLPDQIEMTKRMLPSTFQQEEDYKAVYDAINEAQFTAYGVVVNSFQELEPKYVKECLKIKSYKVWCIGPLSLCNKETLDKFERGNKASIDENHCLKWLDSRAPNSVVYACLGSLCNLASSDLKEIGLALEASKRPFVWVIRGGDKYFEVEKWLSEEDFEERNKDRGLVIKGWAPQVLILSHKAIGGFLTHCGWNSILEGVSAGVPMATFPLFAEQFFNEKLVVQVLKIAVSVGVDATTAGLEEGKVGDASKKENVEKAVNKLMEGSEDGEKRRRRVRELRDRARQAMEDGGSSHFNMTLFIQDIMHHVSKKSSIKEKTME